MRFGGCAGVYWSKTNATQENQSTLCVKIWMVMSQRVIEWIRNLCLNVFCVGWHLAASHKYNSNSLAAVLHINKSNAAGNSKRLYTPALNVTVFVFGILRICLIVYRVNIAPQTGLKTTALFQITSDQHHDATKHEIRIGLSRFSKTPTKIYWF